MKKLSKEQMKQINGGATTTYTTAINAVLKAISTLFSIGQAVGNAIRRSTSGSYCKA
jgi:bacteriocin-like protein